MQTLRQDDVLNLPRDIARCAGCDTLLPDKPVCSLRHTCHRYTSILADEMDAPVPWMMLTDIDGHCEYRIPIWRKKDA
jgi:hypothetical protein